MAVGSHLGSQLGYLPADDGLVGGVVIIALGQGLASGVRTGAGDDERPAGPGIPGSYRPWPRGFDVEVLYIAKRLGFRTIEVPVRWNDVAGTKVTMMRGVAAFLDPLKVRWNGLSGRYR